MPFEIRCPQTFLGKFIVFFGCWVIITSLWVFSIYVSVNRYECLVNNSTIDRSDHNYMIHWEVTSWKNYCRRGHGCDIRHNQQNTTIIDQADNLIQAQQIKNNFHIDQIYTCYLVKNNFQFDNPESPQFNIALIATIIGSGVFILGIIIQLCLNCYHRRAKIKEVTEDMWYGTKLQEWSHNMI